jgi:hypothetical protein
LGRPRVFLTKKWTLDNFLATKCWLVSAWEGVSKYVIDVSLPLAAELPLQQENEQLVMDLVLKQGLSKSRRKAVNRVRLYLRVILLADISTGDGRYICPEFLSTLQLRRLTPTKSLLTWPVEKPLRKDFGIWVSIMNTITRNAFLLHRRLGDWVHPPLRGQLWRYNNTTKILYGRTPSTQWKAYKSFQGTGTRGNRQRFRAQSELLELPHECTLWPASATLLRNGGVIFTGAARCRLVDTDTLSLSELLEGNDDANWMWKETALGA